MKLPKYSKKQNKPKSLILIRRVKGKSMMPLIKPNSLVFIRSKLTASLDNKVVIFSHHGIDKIKRVVDQEDDYVYLLGDNLINSSDSRSFSRASVASIVGYVIWPRV